MFAARLLSFLFSLILALNVHAQVSEVKGDLMPGFDAAKNMIKNPEFEQGVKLGVIDSSSITAANIATPISGKRSLNITGTTAGQVVKIRANAIQVRQQGQSCRASFTYKGDASKYKAYVVQGSTVVSAESFLQLVSDGSRTADIYFACGTSALVYDVAIESIATASVITVDSVFLGTFSPTVGFSETGMKKYGPIGITSTGGGSPTSGPTPLFNEFWARAAGPYLEVQFRYGHQGGGGSDPSSGTYLYEIPAATGCKIDAEQAPFHTGGDGAQAQTSFGNVQLGVDGTALKTGHAVPYDATHFRLNLIDQGYQSNGVFQFAAATLHISSEVLKIPCVGWGPRTSLPPDQVDTKAVDFDANTNSQGLGTMTMKKCTWSRLGQKIEVECDLQTGTVSAVEGRIGLPGNFITSTTLLPTNPNGAGTARVVGKITRGVPTGQVDVNVLAQPGVNYLNIGFADGSTGGTAILNANSVVGSNENISFKASVFIEGWDETGRARQLDGSVISAGSKRALNFFSTIYGGATATTDCTAVGACTLYENTGDITSVTGANNGTYVVAIRPGACVGVPKCHVSPAYNGAVLTAAMNSSSSSAVATAATPTSVTFTTWNISPVSVYTSFGNITCDCTR